MRGAEVGYLATSNGGFSNSAWADDDLVAAPGDAFGQVGQTWAFIDGIHLAGDGET
ncbi:MAG: hypothetical protein R3F49_24060 [Planctomycetota bacterium]